MSLTNFDLRHMGKFVASYFKIGETDISIIADRDYDRTMVCFNFEPVEYLNGTTRRVVKETFEAALKRYRLVYGEPTKNELLAYNKELEHALKITKTNLEEDIEKVEDEDLAPEKC